MTTLASRLSKLQIDIGAEFQDIADEFDALLADAREEQPKVSDEASERIIEGYLLDGVAEDAHEIVSRFGDTFAEAVIEEGLAARFDADNVRHILSELESLATSVADVRYTGLDEAPDELLQLSYAIGRQVDELRGELEQ